MRKSRLRTGFADGLSDVVATSLILPYHLLHHQLYPTCQLLSSLPPHSPPADMTALLFGSVHVQAPSKLWMHAHQSSPCYSSLLSNACVCVCTFFDQLTILHYFNLHHPIYLNKCDKNTRVINHGCKKTHINFNY